MPQHLHDMDIDSVSLVDKGANDKRFAILKRQPMVSVLPDATGTTGAVDVLEVEQSPDVLELDAQGPSDGGIRAAFAKVAQALGISKVDEFDDITAEQEMFTAVDEGFNTLRSAVTSGMFGRDDDGNELSKEAKATSIGASIDQFKAFILDSMSVEKSGRKISGARMTQIKGAFKVLGELINGVENGYWTPETSSIGKGSDDMTIDELNTAIDERVAKAYEEGGVALTAIAKAVTDGLATKAEVPVAPVAPVVPAVAPVAKTEEDSDVIKRLDEIAATQGQTIEAVAKLLDRTEALEAGRRQSVATPADAGQVPVAKRNPLTGILG